MPPAKPSRSLVYVAVACALAAAAPRLVAEPTEYQVNVREACRRDVAGTYLRAYDDREQHRTLVKTLDARLAELRSAHAKAQADLTAAQKAVDGHSYEAKLAAERDAAQGVVRSLGVQIQTYEAQRKTAQDELGGTTAREARLRKVVETVFVFKRVEDKPDGGYPFLVEWRAPCPKYRALCPLPARDADLLKALDLGDGVPEPCARYASFSRIP